MTYRHPSVLAAEAITIDHASEGRLELAIGAAWFEPEHRALGISFPAAGTRIEMLAEALTILRGLFTEDGFSFEGRYWQLHEATLRPRPVQQPHPPIWVGASGEERMLPLTARYADAWHAFGDVAAMSRKSKLLDEFAARDGRDPASILRAASLDLSQPWDEARRQADALRDVGFGYLVCGWPSEGRARVEEFVAQVMPELAAS